MADLVTYENMALALGDVTPKRHFRYDGFAVGGKVFVHLNKGDLMLGAPAADAERFASEHPGLVAVLRRNDKPIGMRAELAALPDDLLRRLLETAHAHVKGKG